MLQNSFCSSPWFHVRLTYDGGFELCRWAEREHRPNKSESIMEFYRGADMNALRQELLDGVKPSVCHACYYQDDHDKLSGRRRQLLKSGIDSDNFALTARSSPHYKHFLYSLEHQGETDYHISDLQIDLGNVCNSACIMCNPMASSKLVGDYKKLSKIEPELFAAPTDFKSWTLNPDRLTSVSDEISSLTGVKYIHFLGGETLYDEAFYEICEKLIESGQAKDIIVGTTTNGTIYTDRLAKLIPAFKEFHLGISIESVTELNDYIRWPSKITTVKENIEKFLDLRNSAGGLFISARITPNIFTIRELPLMIEYLMDKNIIAESCFILHTPDGLRIENLPDDIRQEIITSFGDLINKHRFIKEPITNQRRADLIQQVIANTVIEYHDFLKSYQLPDDVEASRRRLVRFLKSFETLRNNSILDHAPRYSDFLRSYGY